MEWLQKEISLKARKRGMHIITEELLDAFPELSQIKTGILHIFIKHTSASLTINENVSPDVRIDIESHLNKLIPENASHYTHTMEGPDDMPAHIKASLLGSGLTIPISKGRLNLGTWQGIYLCEHRNHAGNRRVVITVMGEKKD